MSAPVGSPSVATWSANGSREVCICGVGARTSVGLGADASAAAVRASISGLASHPEFVDQEDEPVSFAADPSLSPTLSLAERMLAMLRSAAEEAVEGLPSTLAPDGVWLAVAEPRSGLPTDVGEMLAGSIGDLGVAAVRVVPRGHAGGLMALQAAAAAVANGSVEMALVAGVDSYHDPRTIASLDLHRRLMCGRNPSGFPVGEGAGACLLVSGKLAKRHGWSILARVRAAATAVEPQTLRSTEPCLGEGLTAVFVATAGGLSASDPKRFDNAYCDLNGERYRNDEYAYAMMRAGETFVDGHDYVSPADCWGDVGAASGALFAVLAIAAGSRGYAKGPIAVLWAGADSGHRSAVALEVPIGVRP